VLDPRILATNHAIIVYSTLEAIRDRNLCVKQEATAGKEEKKKEYGKGLRSRAREAPSLMAQSGIAGLLTFYASKAGADKFTKLAEYIRVVSSNARKMEDFKNNVLKNVEVFKNYLCEELKPGEARGYGLMLALIAYALKEYGLWKDSLDFVGLAQTSREMLENPAIDQAAQALLLEYLLHFKRMVEAIITL